MTNCVKVAVVCHVFVSLTVPAFSSFQIGVPSNLYALYHAAVQLKQKNELGVYLINLTVSDLLYLASLPLWLQYIFQVS